ncbi:MAG TPA: hypothetical protein VIL35_11495 [Vicinamibacterales bacterium]
MKRELTILTLAFVVSLPLVTPRIYASDEVQYFSYLRSLWFDRDVSFENEYRHFYDTGVTQYPGFHETFLERETETGRRISFATIGSALLWSPFYAVADAAVRTGIAGDVPRDGFSRPYVAAVAFGSAFYGWLAVVIGWAMARRLGWSRGALAAALAVWVGTPIFFYMYIAPPMSHGCSAFAVASFLAVWLLVRERWSAGGAMALGALAALMGMVREQDLFVAAGPAIDWGWQLWRAGRGRDAVTARRLVVAAVAGGIAFTIAYLPQLWAYLVLNGYPGPSRLVARKMNWLAPHALGVLASPQHGLLFWTPLVLLPLAGLILAAARERTRRGSELAIVALALLAVIAVQVYVAGSVESWTVAGAFGQRRFVGLSAVFIVGLAALASTASTSRARATAFAIAVALCVWWNVGLMAQFGSGLMDRQRLEIGRNAYHTFVTVPSRLPDLAYRYLFRRSSFYQTDVRPGTAR